MRSITRFTDKYPLLGPIVWILTVQYFVAQVIAAAAWVHPPYRWSYNFISDLGATLCGRYGTRTICSPDHALMNASFVLLGITMAVGSLLIHQEFRETKASRVGFSLMALGGIGTIIVGLFPENVLLPAHLFGAFLALCVGNIALIVLARTIWERSKTWYRYTLITGIVSLLAIILLVAHIYLHIGPGGMERMASYPQALWLILFGVYMSRNHLRSTKLRGRAHSTKTT